MLSINNRTLTIAQTRARSAILNAIWSPVLRFHSIPRGELPPPVPRDIFGRDELVGKVVGLAESFKPIALIGTGGIGKTSVALAVLHHDRIQERFGENRRFIRCDQFPASRTHFLARLSKVIGAGLENPEDLTSLRSFLSSKEMFIILDNAESILDPKGTGAKEIYPVVDELCQFKTMCLLITSRITTVPPRCKRPEIPTLSMEAACDIFYGIYGDRERSSIINDLLQRLDFHALSITLLATTASHNAWDYSRLAKEWNTQRVRVLQTEYNESLAATIELSLASPTFHSLGPTARDLLGVVAFFPQGIDEKNLDWLFPTIPKKTSIFDKFCLLSLAYRSKGFVTMLSPIRDYLVPQDPRSSPLLCATRDCYFSRLSVNVDPGRPGFEEALWVVSEDINVEHLLDVFISIDPDSSDIWDVCFNFMRHLHWHKPRQTTLNSKIEALPDDHRSKPKCLSELSRLLGAIGNHAERKRHLTCALELERRWGNDSWVALILRQLAGVNQLLELYEEGIQQAEEAFKIHERISDTAGQIRCLNGLARLLLGDEQLDAAENAALRGIGLITEEGEKYNLCELHRVLGQIHRSKGEKKKAVHHCNMALEIASFSNWHGELFWIHYELADLFRSEGEFDDANAHIERAKSHTVNDTYDLGCLMYIQGHVWYGQRRLEDSKSEVLHALEIFEELGSTKDASNCRELLETAEQAIKNRSTPPQR